MHAALAQTFLDEIEQLSGARLQDFRHGAQADHLRLRIVDFNFSVLGHRGHHGVAILALKLFCAGHGHLQADGKIVGKVRAANGHGTGVRNRALKEDSEIAGVRADIDEADSQFALVGGERGFSGGDGLEHRFSNFQASAVGAGDGALQSRAGAGGNVQVHFEPRADHAHGIEDAGLIVHDELARKQVENFAVGRALYRAGALHRGANIIAGNLAHAAAQIEAAVGVDAANVRVRLRPLRIRRCWHGPRARHVPPQP